jgi:hypothetical protein
MFPTTKRTTQRALLQASLLLALLIATAGIGHSQTASPCLSSQLSAHHETGDQSMGGHISAYYSFRNDSKSPCTLNGTPALAFFDRAGRRMKINVERDPKQPKLVTIEPGGKAFFSFDYTSCGVQNQAVVHKSRCSSSTKLGFTPPGTKGMVMIRESIDDVNISGLTPVVATLEEIGGSAESADAEKKARIAAESECKDSQLSLHREATDSAMGGKRSIFYSFKNTSQKPCTLQGWPYYMLLDSAGRKIKPPMPPGEGVADEPKPVTLAPGGKAFFSVNYTSCESITITSGSRKPCKSSAKAQIQVGGMKRMFVIREVIDHEGATKPFGADYDVSPISSTLEELGISIEKRKP